MAGLSIKRNTAIDYCKYISSLMIVAIHTELFHDINEELCFVFVQVICRLAVPYFALTTGYYLTKAIIDNRQIKSGKSQWMKILKIYLTWALIYFIFVYPRYWHDGLFVYLKWYTIDTLTHGAHYHLWYILSLLVALPIFVFLVDKINQKIKYICAIPLYLFFVYIYAYNEIIPPAGIIERILLINDIIPSIISGVFLIFPYLLIGSALSRRSNYIKHLSKYSGILTILFLTCQIFEANWLRNYGVNQWTYIFFSLPAAICFFCWILKQNPFIACCKNDISTLLGNCSIIVYCIHPIIIEIIGAKVLPSLTLFLITAVISTICGLTINYLKRRLFIHL